MAPTKTKCGGKGRLSIFRMEKTDDAGNITDVWFEVWDGGTQINGNFSSYDDAFAFVEVKLKAEQNPKPPSSGFRQGM